MYLLIEVRHNILIQFHRKWIEVTDFYYLDVLNRHFSKLQNRYPEGCFFRVRGSKCCLDTLLAKTISWTAGRLLDTHSPTP